MRKIVNMFSKISSGVKDTFSKFPITIVLVYILTIFCVLFYDSEIIKSYVFENILFVGGVSLLGVLLVESNREKLNDIIRKIGIGLAFTIAVIFYILIDSLIDGLEIVFRCFITYIISISILIIYSLAKNSGVEFKEYILKVFSSVFKFSIAYGILNIGILLLSLAFIELILDGEGWSLVGRALLLLLGFFYIPVIIHSLTEMKTEVSKFVRGLILYVLLPLIAIGMVIIYMYIIKITVNGEFPKNSVFAMLAVLFVFLYPTCIMARNYKDESKIIDIISKILMYLYIPFVFLEIYAMGIRTSEYGLTPSRYLAYIFVAFQIVFIFMTLFKDSKYIKESLLLGIVFVIFIQLTPFTPERVANLSQKKILEEYANKDKELSEYSKEDQAKFVGAYEYLVYEDEEYMPDLTNEQKDELEKFNTRYWSGENYYDDNYDDEQYYVDYKYLNCRNELEGLDVSEYSKIYEIDTSYDNYKSYNISFGNYNMDINFEEYVEELIEENEDGKKDIFFKENALIETENEDIDIYLTSISVGYNLLEDKVINFVVKGYALEK